MNRKQLREKQEQLSVLAFEHYTERRLDERSSEELISIRKLIRFVGGVAVGVAILGAYGVVTRNDVFSADVLLGAPIVGALLGASESLSHVSGAIDKLLIKSGVEVSYLEASIDVPDVLSVENP